MGMKDVPKDMTLEEAIGNATKVGSGLTSYNEIILGPYDAEDVSGLFWAHTGEFRAPRVTDPGAMKLACSFKETNTSLPVFEFAYVNLERPFEGCQSLPSLDCL